MTKELTAFCIKHPNCAVRLNTCIECDKERLDEMIKSFESQGLHNVTFSPPSGYSHKSIYTTGYLSFHEGVQKIPIQFSHEEKRLKLPNEEDDYVDFPSFIPDSKEGEILRLVGKYKEIYNNYIKSKKELAEKINEIINEHSKYCMCYKCQQKK